jgi:16S rRNA (cytosine1402-N4)-methyltransferase
MSYHTPVLLHESVEGLRIKADGIYVDVTFGSGGHSREILKRITTGRLLAFDQDPDAEVNLITDDRFIFIRHNFRFLSNFLRYHQVTQVDGILADLGVSSHQFDQPSRGFSYREPALLDMRMNPASPTSARDILNKYDERRLQQMFRDYGELSNAGKLASVIIRARKGSEICHTDQFIRLIRECIPGKLENKYLSKVFQALRIEVNNEMGNLKELLDQSVKFLKPGGRMVIITYHSLEDRLVKNFFRAGNMKGTIEKDLYGNFEAPFRQVNNKVIVPSPTEVKNNPRARSAKMRIGERK